jgi:hypothetical protein
MIAKKDPNSLESNEQFITYDIGLAATLVTLGYNLVDVDKTNPRKSQFMFRRDEQIDKMVNKYWDNSLNLPARSLVDNLKMLKNRLYSVIV